MGALADDIPLEFGERPEDVEDQFPSGCGGVDCLGDRFEAYSLVVEAGDRLDEVLE